MADKAMDVYLNDHLAGAMLGSALAEQLREENEGTPLGNAMSALAPAIEEDRKTLIDLMDRMGTSKNPVKQATTWLAEKAARLKFSGLTSGEPKVGTFMALENLTLGVEGKVSLWKALKEVAGQYEPLEWMNLDELIERAEAQRDALERERIAAGARALGAVATRPWKPLAASRRARVKAVDVRVRGCARGTTSIRPELRGAGVLDIDALRARTPRCRAESKPGVGSDCPMSCLEPRQTSLL